MCALYGFLFHAFHKIFKDEANINEYNFYPRRSVVISISKFCLLVVFFKCVDCGTKVYELTLVFDAEVILITEMATLIILFEVIRFFDVPVFCLYFDEFF